MSFAVPSQSKASLGRPTQIRPSITAMVAGTLLRDREVVLRRLRQLGIQALDAPPAQVTPWLINTYLEIKRRELI